MLGLPQSTEVKRSLPKAQLFKRFDWKPSQRDCFDGDVARLDFTNWISPRTLPAIAEGDEVKELFVIEVSLKKRDFDTKSFVFLAKSIPQRIIYALRFEDDVMLAVYHSKLLTSDWQPSDTATLSLAGLNLDAVWVNVVCQIADINSSLLIPNSSLIESLSEQIKDDEEHAKLMRQIESLERQMNATKQPRRKRELFLEIQKLKQYNG
ncbi:MAG: DUF4391 domain-containing protein [Muribaculum sp.]|nr:DUF4391 domain-containing protein [Muribaculum sp.]